MTVFELPQPTDTENETLILHIVGWVDCSPLQQALCLAILRGHSDPSEIAAYLGVNAKAVQRAAGELIGKGLLWDNHKLLLH